MTSLKFLILSDWLLACFEVRLINQGCHKLNTRIDLLSSQFDKQT